MKLVLRFITLFPIVLKRLMHHSGLAISSGIGILSILSLVVCEPVFANAVLSKVLETQLTEKAVKNHRSLFSMHVYYRDNKLYTPLSVENARVVSRYIRQRLEEGMGLAVNQIVIQVNSQQFTWSPIQIQSSRPLNPIIYRNFVSSDILKDKIKMVEGVWPQAPGEAGDVIEVAVQEDNADDFFLNVGDIYQSESLTVQIVGIFRAIDPNDPVWFYNPKITFQSGFWVPMEFFETLMPEIASRPLSYTSWYTIVDDRSLRFSQSLNYTVQMTRLEKELTRMLPAGSIDYSPSDMLVAFENRLKSMTVMFYAAGAPMLALAIFFIVLTAAIAIRQYEIENAVLGARGGSWGQMVMLNIVESLALIIFTLPFALFVGLAAAAVMGQTELFLRFTPRSEFDYSLHDVNYFWLALAGFVIILARLVPLMTGVRPSILSLKQERSRTAQKPAWERFYLDILLLIPATYAYLTMRGRMNASTAPVEGATQTAYDPLVFLASSIFAIAFCMFGLRIFQWLTRLLALVTSRLHQAWIFLAVQEIARNPREHASAMLLVMISLSFAIFTASMAKTLDRWMRDSQFYQSGAELAVREFELPSEAGPLIQGDSGGSPASTRGTDAMVSLERHLKLSTIRSATYVGKWPARINIGGKMQEFTLMGIDRLTFPSAAFYRKDFADQSLGALMNALSGPSIGVLIPQALSENSGLQTGDRLRVEANIGVGGELVIVNMDIVGVYRYFPTVYPSEAPTLITNLDSLFGGPDLITGVEVWLNLVKGTNVEKALDSLRKEAVRNYLWVEVRGNALEMVSKATSQPEWVGLFGILNVGFLLTGVLPAIGFILYSSASLRKRSVQFGLLQALGLSASQMEASLTLEQILLMFGAVAGGAGVGFLTSGLYLPFLQVSVAGNTPVPPFEVLIGWKEAAWLSLAFTGIFVLALAAMMVSLRRLKIVQVMEMGEAV